MLTVSQTNFCPYIFCVGFTVRPNSAAKFEKRWADRSSRLASLDGFRYFHLMRRVALDDEANSGEFVL